MEFFEKLPEEIQSHVFSFCDARGLLKVMETSSFYKKFVSNEAKLMKKIRLVVDFEEVFTINELLKIVQSRKFYAVRFVNLGKVLQTDRQVKQAMPWLKALSETLEDLKLNFNWYPVKTSVYEKLIRMFLPKLRICIISLFMLVDDGKNQDEVVLVASPLKTLIIDETATRSLNVFFGCKQIESFELDQLEPKNVGSLTRIETVWKLLGQLKDLKRLKMYPRKNVFIGPSWLEMPFQLDELSLVLQKEEEAQIIAFTKQQRKLKKLSFDFDGKFSKELMKTVCDLPLLIEFGVDGLCETINFEELSNTTVKTLVVAQTFWIEFLMPVFRSTNKILFSVIYFEYTESLRGMQDIIEFGQNGITFIFNPERIIGPIRNIERDILKFFERNSRLITSVCIGWRDNGILLSYEFSQQVIQLLPNLNTLKLKNVA